jgi:hypothetical protein
MNTAENIRRLEVVLASPFWGDDVRHCIMEKITLTIKGVAGAYRWRLDDADDGSYVKYVGSFPSVAAARDSLRGVLEEGLGRKRGAASTP